ncbi:conjugal transfer protein TraB [Brucella endophytica]|uniref:conjugal transfer protein TraB n=1 Tax=Brucella endophytica TaxID=1963359 RepID=UPI001F0BA453|nr:conjugal transfer protein TraB [Brucella endophytica]
MIDQPGVRVVVAIAHFSVSIISRGDGRSAVLSAAYRHCAKMDYEREARSVDYSHKQGLLHEEFVLPPGAPEWVRMLIADRSAAGAAEAFWNKVEAFEKRSDAQLAKDLTIALPLELLAEQNIALVRDFVERQILSKGMVADWVYHDNPGNPHIHLMMTLRPLTEDAALWAKRPEAGHRGRAGAARYLAAAVLMGLPPFGITGWAHPITSAGVLFPGWGWWGLAAAAAGLAMMASRYWPAAAIALGGFWFWSAATWTQPVLPHGWKGVDLEYGASLGRKASLEYHRDLIATVRRQAGAGSRVVVLPESAIGFWTPSVARLWQEGLGSFDVTVLAGAAVIDQAGYDNVMVAISGPEARILYRERMPLPVSMWQPWRAWTGQGGGARVHLFANPFVDLAGTRIAPLICYEQLILWPVLQSMLHAPDLIVATGNGWWTARTSIVAIQRASAAAWAKLFGMPVVMAFNM